MPTTMLVRHTVRLRRDLPIIALGVVVALGGFVRRARQAESGQPEATLTPKLTFLEQKVLTAVPPVVVAPASLLTRAEMPDIDHPYVDKWVARFSGDQRRDFHATLGRMSSYLPMITAKLAKRGMPPELAYLAFIESGGNARATSPVKAKGLWQFMSATARQYGLKVGRRVDERTNPAKSTDAALTYLSSLYDRFGSWYLAAAAYNTGAGRVARVLQQVTGRSTGTDADFYRIAPGLPAETREYVPRLVAAARVARADGGQTPAAGE